MLATAPSDTSWLATLPTAVPSSERETAGSPDASDVAWHSRLFFDPPPTIRIRLKASPGEALERLCGFRVAAAKRLNNEPNVSGKASRRLCPAEAQLGVDRRPHVLWVEKARVPNIQVRGRPGGGGRGGQQVGPLRAARVDIKRKRGSFRSARGPGSERSGRYRPSPIRSFEMRAFRASRPVTGLSLSKPTRDHVPELR